MSVWRTDERGPGGCRKTMEDTVIATPGRGDGGWNEGGEGDGERNGRLERNGGGGRFKGSGAIQGKPAGFQPGRLDGWSVNREGGRTGRADEEFHMQDDQFAIILGLPSPTPHFTDGESEA